MLFRVKFPLYAVLLFGLCPCAVPVCSCCSACVWTVSRHCLTSFETVCSQCFPPAFVQCVFCRDSRSLCVFLLCACLLFLVFVFDFDRSRRLCHSGRPVHCEGYTRCDRDTLRSYKTLRTAILVFISFAALDQST